MSNEQRVTIGNRVRVIVEGEMTGITDTGTLTVQYPSDLGTCETTVELEGTQVKVEGLSPPDLSRAQAKDQARHNVIKAALRLAASDWGNGRETAYDSMDLDHAHDRFDEALARYVELADA